MLSDTIIGALIGGGCTIGAALLSGVRVSDILKRRALVTDELKEMIEGKWVGKTIEKSEDLKEDAYSYDVTWDFKISGRDITADSTMSYIE